MRGKSKSTATLLQTVAQATPMATVPPGAVERRPAPVAKSVVRLIFERFRDADPDPKSELHAPNAFTFLVAVVLSAQATDAGVNKATPALFAFADTPEKMVELGEDRVRDLIKSIGLFRTKAKNIVALSTILAEQFGGEVPNTREALENLPGVGRKTANVVLNSCFGVPVIAVDTHLFRVSNRIPLARGDTPLAVEAGLMATIPVEFQQYAHHWLILHGRYTCLARTPRCSTCRVSDLCQWPEKRIDGMPASIEEPKNSEADQ